VKSSFGPRPGREPDRWAYANIRTYTHALCRFSKMSIMSVYIWNTSGAKCTTCSKQTHKINNQTNSCYYIRSETVQNNIKLAHFWQLLESK